MVIQFHCLCLQKIEDTYIILFDDHISFPTRLHVQNSIPEERNERFLTLICYFLSDWHADGSIGEFLDYGHVDNVWKENPYGVDESGGKGRICSEYFAAVMVMTSNGASGCLPNIANVDDIF
jgi:hypothetical protein